MYFDFISWIHIVQCNKQACVHALFTFHSCDKEIFRYMNKKSINKTI